VLSTTLLDCCCCCSTRLVSWSSPYNYPLPPTLFSYAVLDKRKGTRAFYLSRCRPQRRLARRLDMTDRNPKVRPSTYDSTCFQIEVAAADKWATQSSPTLHSQFIYVRVEHNQIGNCHYQSESCTLPQQQLSSAHVKIVSRINQSKWLWLTDWYRSVAVALLQVPWCCVAVVAEQKKDELGSYFSWNQLGKLLKKRETSTNPWCRTSWSDFLPLRSRLSSTTAVK